MVVTDDASDIHMDLVYGGFFKAHTSGAMVPGAYAGDDKTKTIL